MYTTNLKVSSLNTINSKLNNSAFDSWTSFLDVKPSTIETYKKSIRQFSDFLRSNNISSPTREDILNYKKSLLENRKPATVNNYLMAVKQFFKWTEINGIYPNIAVNIKGVKLDKGFKKDCLTLKQVRKVLKSINRNSIKGLRDYAIILLMVTTGLRTFEVMGANVEDFRTLGDFTVLYIQSKGREGKNTYVKVSEPAEKAIRKYLSGRGTLNDKEPLFASTAKRNEGGRLTTRSIRGIVKEILINSNLNSNRLTAHSLRHTTATLNLLNGGTPEETMQLLRHSNLNTTLIYSHNLKRAKNNSEIRISNAIFEAELI